MSAVPECPLTTLALTALGTGLVCAALQATSWQSRQVARFIVALPLVAVLMVFISMTSAGPDHTCLARTREELEIYLVYSVVSFVFVLVWLGCLGQAVDRLDSTKLGVLASGLVALVAWVICMASLLLVVFSSHEQRE